MTRRTTHNLAGQVAVVTGAARGLGEALARELAARGARLALVGLEPERLARVAANLPGTGHSHWHADVTDPAAMAEVAEEVTARYRAVDIVVANAGVGLGGAFEESDEETWRRVIEVNLMGSATTARAFLPALRDSKGYFLQIASLAAIVPAPLMTAYCASKSGAEAFAHSLRAELAPTGVRVGVAYLSWTDTDLLRAADADTYAGTPAREMRRRIPGPAGRVYPLGPAAARIAAGVERRSAHVYAPPWLRTTQALRATLPPLITAVARRVLTPGPPSPGQERRTLLGPGGAAAHRSQKR
jgi:NAD(P)-dependent dehydrogenase (short-subunit alcohol dehydrogenase family)